MIKNKRVLVTGGSGFIGSHLCSELLKHKNKVMILNRGMNGNTRLLIKKGALFIQGDVTDRASVDKAMKNVDIVFHLAAAFTNYKKQENYYWNVNVSGTKNVLDAAVDHKVKRFVNCTTAGVLGHVEQLPANENTPYNPCDIYERTKMESEKLGMRYHQEKGLPLTTIRPSGIYGPGDKRHLLLFKTIQKGVFPFIGKRNKIRDMCYVDDLVRALILAAEKKEAVGKIYIVSNEQVTIEKLAKSIARIMGAKPIYVTIPVGPVVFIATIIEKVSKLLGISPPLFRRRIGFFTEQRYVDSSKIRKELGYKPRINYETGLKKTYEWYKKQGWL